MSPINQTDPMQEIIETLKVRYAALNVIKLALEQWIVKYGQHGSKCTVGPYAVKNECFCGLSELLKSLEK